eukprot:UN33516
MPIVPRNTNQLPESGNAPLIFESAPKRVPTPINVDVMLKNMEIEARSDPALRPFLEGVRNRAASGYDITQEILKFNTAIATGQTRSLKLSPLRSNFSERAPGSAQKRPKKRKHHEANFRNHDPHSRKFKKPKQEKPETVWTHSDGSITFFALFDNSELKKLHKRSLKLLYSEKLERCHTCGLRLKMEDISAHHDAHFKENKEQEQRGKQARMRVWYLPYQDWFRDATVRSKSATLFFPDKIEEETKPTVIKQVLASEHYTDCKICGEKFKRVFDQHTEDWVYVGAVYANGETRSLRPQAIVHQSCFET